MVLSRGVARFNRVALNRLTRPIASRLPGFAVVVHRGRKSGRSYRTPVNAFPADDGYVFALTYGSDADWVRNVVAAGRCELDTRGHRLSLVSPRVFHDESRRHIRVAERQVLKLTGVADFLEMKIDRTGVSA